MAERGERASAGRPEEKGSSSEPLKLADLGVTKKQSHNWQKLAEMPEEAFDAKAATAKKRVVAAVDGALVI